MTGTSDSEPGSIDSEPGSMQYVTLIGYVQLSSIGDREVIGNAS
ncbi:hypothetical protein [Arthrobacter sp. ISL-5]|nr:hypothetical protein [Arthrobacter sp. ISL-5]